MSIVYNLGTFFVESRIVQKVNKRTDIQNLNLGLIELKFSKINKLKYSFPQFVTFLHEIIIMPSAFEYFFPKKQ